MEITISLIVGVVSQFLLILLTGGKHPLLETSNWIMQILTWLTFLGYAIQCIIALVASVMEKDLKIMLKNFILVLVLNIAVVIFVKLTVVFGIILGAIVFIGIIVLVIIL